MVGGAKQKHIERDRDRERFLRVNIFVCVRGRLHKSGRNRKKTRNCSLVIRRWVSFLFPLDVRYAISLSLSFRFCIPCISLDWLFRFSLFSLSLPLVFPDVLGGTKRLGTDLSRSFPSDRFPCSSLSLTPQKEKDIHLQKKKKKIIFVRNQGRDSSHWTFEIIVEVWGNA